MSRDPEREPGPAHFPYGEWPAHNARFGATELTWAVLVVRHVDVDTVVLIGSCPAGDQDGPRDCFAEAAGYQWSFRGSVFDSQDLDPGHVRLRIRSEGAFHVEPKA